jgi:hypothetical protein
MEILELKQNTHLVVVYYNGRKLKNSRIHVDVILADV